MVFVSPSYINQAIFHPFFLLPLILSRLTILYTEGKKKRRGDSEGEVQVTGGEGKGVKMGGRVVRGRIGEGKEKKEKSRNERGVRSE